MSVQGKKREVKEFALQVGLFEAIPVSFNPNREELEKLLNIQLEKDPEYLKEDDKDNAQVNMLAVWVKEVKTGKLFKIGFYLKDKVRTNKNGDKTQYINSVGTCSWADDPQNLPDWFTSGNRTYREAKVGEEELYNFVKSWLYLDYKDPDTNLDLEWSKLMRGNIKSLKEHIGGTYTTDDKGNPSTIVCLATVRTAEDSEGKPKDFQQVWTRAFLPGYTMKFFRAAGKNTPKSVTRFIDQVEDPEYGPKDFFGLELKELHDYNPEENIATADVSGLSEDGPDLG